MKINSPGLADSAGGCIAKARQDGESGPKALYENHFHRLNFPGLVDSLGGCLAEARLAGESGP